MATLGSEPVVEGIQVNFTAFYILVSFRPDDSDSDQTI